MAYHKRRKPNLHLKFDEGNVSEFHTQKRKRISCQDCANYIEPLYCKQFNLDLHSLSNALKCKGFVVKTESIKKYMDYLENKKK